MTPTRTRHYWGEILQNYHMFALFDPPKWVIQWSLLKVTSNKLGEIIPLISGWKWSGVKPSYFRPIYRRLYPNPNMEISRFGIFLWTNHMDLAETVNFASMVGSETSRSEEEKVSCSSSLKLAIFCPWRSKPSPTSPGVFSRVLGKLNGEPVATWKRLGKNQGEDIRKNDQVITRNSWHNFWRRRWW